MASIGKQLLLYISSNTNQFVDLKCLSFKNLYVTNSDSETIAINLVVGKDDNAGQTSVTNGAYVLQGVSIPQGVTMCIPAMNFRSLRKAAGIAASTNPTVIGSSPAITGALAEDDYTVLISANATNKVFTVYVEYN